MKIEEKHKKGDVEEEGIKRAKELLKETVENFDEDEISQLWHQKV